MNSLENLATRIDDLETKITFQDDLIEKLNQSLINQQSDLRKLTSIIERLNSRLDDLQNPNITDDINQPPPHY